MRYGEVSFFGINQFVWCVVYESLEGSNQENKKNNKKSLLQDAKSRNYEIKSRNYEIKSRNYEIKSRNYEKTMSYLRK